MVLLSSKGKSFIEGLLESINRWKNEFIWLNALQFSFANIFHYPGTIEDQIHRRKNDHRQEISKIVGRVDEKFPEAMLGQVGMNPHWIRMGGFPALFAREKGYSCNYIFFLNLYVYRVLLGVVFECFPISIFFKNDDRTPFRFSDFVESRITAKDIGSDDFDLSVMDV